MSYIRFGSVYKYVEGESKDYIYPSENIIVDYGDISNETLIELLFRHADIRDNICPKFNDVLTQYILTKLAERLKVKLRRVPLSDDKCMKIYIKKLKKVKGKKK